MARRSHRSKVVKELIDAILKADWLRFEDESTGRFYYVVRESDRRVLEAEGKDWNSVTLAVAEGHSEFEDRFVRASLAEPLDDHMELTRTRLLRSGIPSAFVDTFVQQVRQAQTHADFVAALDTCVSEMTQGGTADFTNLMGLLEAMRVEGTRKGFLFLGDADRGAIDAALESRLLRELAERFPKAVKRASEFVRERDWPSVQSQQLRESIRCYVYGFFGAAILTTSAALEERLKETAQLGFFDSYASLIGSVFGPGGVLGSDEAMTKALSDLFLLRNRVAHDGEIPSPEDALRAIQTTRAALERMP